VSAAAGAARLPAHEAAHRLLVLLVVEVDRHVALVALVVCCVRQGRAEEAGQRWWLPQWQPVSGDDGSAGQGDRIGLS
jgi:hypothetical protein